MQLRRYGVNRTSSASCCCRVTWKERCRLDAGLAILYVFGRNPARHRLNDAVVAVTSATSAEQIAVSSIGAYDVYKRYINPKASDKQILRADIISIGIYAIFMGVFGTIWCVCNRSDGLRSLIVFEDSQVLHWHQHGLFVSLHAYAIWLG